MNLKPCEKYANDVIQLHLDNGLSQEQAERAALTSLSFTLRVGVYPGYHSLVKKAENYSIHPPKNSEKDINVITNKIKVKVKSYINETETIVEVEPHITDIQSLSTYLSGGFALYN